MKLGYSIIALNIALFGALAPSAMAQSANGNPFFRHRFVAVTERAQPEYDPVPIHAGAFMINASLNLAAMYNDNIFAQTNNKTSDTVLALTPQIAVTSNWSSNALNAGLLVDRRQYLKNDSENVTNYQGYVGGRLDVTRAFAISAQANGGRFTESRYAPSAVGVASEPVHYEGTGGLIQANYQFNRIQIEGTLNVTKNDYHDVRTIAGPSTPSVVIDQDFRDSTQTNVGGRFSYAVSPDVAVYFLARHGDVSYDQSLPDRDSTRNFYQVGSNFELAAPFRGDIAVGYLQTKQKSGRDFNGPAVDGRLQWFPTEITTVTFSAQRTVFDPGLLNSSVAFDTAVGVHVDHELRRNILLLGDLGYEEQDFQDIDRKDKITSVSAGVGYKLNRRARVDFTYAFRNQDSSGVATPFGPKFSDNSVSVTLRLFP